MSLEKRASLPRIAVAVRKAAFGDGVGGLERAVTSQIEAWLDRGYEVTLFTPARSIRGRVPMRLQIVDVPWPRWDRGGGSPTFGVAYAAWCSRLRSALIARDEVHNIVNLHGATAGALRPGSWTSATVVNPHGMEEFGRSWARWPTRVFLRALVRRGSQADCVIATDINLIAAVERNVGIAREQIEVIANSVDIGWLDALRGGIPTNSQETFAMVTVGRLTENKGYDLLVGALKREDVSRLLPYGWTWTHFGSGSQRTQLLRRAAQSPTVPLTIVSGATDTQVQSALGRSQIFVQPSRYEGSSLTTLEAMTHGCLVVGTPVGGIPDKVRDGETGYLARSVSIDGLADALVRALKLGARHTGKAARESVTARFSSDASNAKYERLFQRLI